MDESKLMGIITHQIEHAVEDAIASPAAINRTVGESMRHIGAFLELSATPYLPVRQEEILVPPERMLPNDRSALLLINQHRPSSQSYMVLAQSKTENGIRRFTVLAYKQDSFNLAQTKFITLPKEVGNEITRQLDKIVQGDGAVLLQAVMIADYFPENTPESTPSAPQAAPVTKGVLPPVSDHGLL